MQKFLLKSTVFSLPFLLLLAGYFWEDPFRVLRSYSNYSEGMLVTMNRDYVSTEMFKKNHADYGYNSFIFGSSRTMGFRSDVWKKYLAANDRPFVYDAHSETVYGLNRKVKYLDQQGVDIKNAIILLCQDASFNAATDSEGHLLQKHPDIASSSWTKFHFEFLRSFFDAKFLFSYFSYKITGEYLSFMQTHIEPRRVYFDPISNDVTVVDQEDEILRDSDAYYKKRVGQFVRLARTERPVIDTSHLVLLEEVRAIFDKKGTDYIVIISPLYDQSPLHPVDLVHLKKVFGPDRVFDYSGVNHFTENMTNYYEWSHFRPQVGSAIMQEVYGEMKKN